MAAGQRAHREDAGETLRLYPFDDVSVRSRSARRSAAKSPTD